MRRTERCRACGGAITADTDDPGPGVLMHIRSPRHQAWRLGMVLEVVDAGLMTVDGLPVCRIRDRQGAA